MVPFAQWRKPVGIDHRCRELVTPRPHKSRASNYLRAPRSNTLQCVRSNPPDILPGCLAEPGQERQRTLAETCPSFRNRLGIVRSAAITTELAEFVFGSAWPLDTTAIRIRCNRSRSDRCRRRHLRVTSLPPCRPRVAAWSWAPCPCRGLS